MEVHMIEISARLSDSEFDCEVECIHPQAVRAARAALAEAPASEHTAGLFAILGDPTRLRVLSALLPGELCVCDLAAATGVNRTTVSHQLRVLRDHRLVRRRREGKVVYYALDDDHVVSLLAIAAAHAAEPDAALQSRRSA
jgi:ArsR family transcriptional regulator, lead/cadmium/zinc/bismuth-responsive transcriptional repressor